MPSDDDKTNKGVDTGGSERKGPKSIFSEEEVRDTVKGFVLDWLRGQVKINFPTAQELVDKSKQEKSEIGFKEAREQEVANKEQFINLILICSGDKPSSPEEQQKACSALFKSILACRAGERIEGEFMDYSVQERLGKLEQKLEVTSGQVQELMSFHREEMGIS